MQRCVPSRGCGVHVGPRLDQKPRNLDGVSQRNAGVQRVVAHGIVRYLVDMGSVLEQQGHSIRAGKGRGEMQWRPAISGYLASSHGIRGYQLPHTLAVAETGCLGNIELPGMPAQKVTDRRPMRVHRPHQR